MICNKCGKEFDGNFCPDCGTSIEEQTTDLIDESETPVEEILTVCPNCGHEREGMGKFCVNCGYNYENNLNSVTSSTQNTNIPPKEKREIKINRSSLMSIIAKVFRFLLAGGMLFIGLVSLLCLTAPTATEEFLGMKNNLPNGFASMGGGSGMPSAITGASVMLLLVSLLTLIYGGWQMYLAIKKPYSTFKKYKYWCIDGTVSLILIILGGVVSTAVSKEGAKLGSGFSMCIVMGVFGLLFLAARIFYELKVFNWESTGLSEEQIAKSLEKRPKRERKNKEINTEAVDSPLLSAQVVTPEIQVAKKRKKQLLTLDWIIALIPIVFVSIMLIILYTPRRNGSILNRYLLIGGILMGSIMVICIFIRLVSEVKAYKWIDPYPNKKLSKKQKILIPTVILIILAVAIVPSVLLSSNIFRIGKVDNIIIGDTYYYVEQVLGKPYEMTDYKYEYYSDNYIELADKIKKGGIEGGLGNYFELVEKLDGLTYKYIAITFDSNRKVTSVLFDAKRCDGKENKKTVKKLDVKGNTSVALYEEAKLTTSVKYSDGSLYKLSVNKIITNTNNDTVEWQDPFGNNLSYKLSVKTKSSLTQDDIKAYANSLGREILGYPSSISIPVSAITEFTIPSNVTSIDNKAFYDCSGLRSIFIPERVTEIDYDAFSRCNNLKIYCEAKSKPSGWSSSWNPGNRPVVWDYKESGVTSNGLQYALTKLGTITIVGYTGSSSSLTIPASIDSHSVTDILSNAFNSNSTIRTLTITQGIKSIGDNAFYNCSYLNAVYIPDSVTKIGEYAFRNSNARIYCEASSRPSGWDSDWNYNGGTVQWGYEANAA